MKNDATTQTLLERLSTTIKNIYKNTRKENGIDNGTILYYMYTTISPSFFFSVIILKICFIILVNMTSLIETGSAAIPKKYHETLGKILFTEEMIEKRVTEMAAQISKDYEGEEILIVGLLKGAILFVADLVRKLTVPSSINFIIASSYGHGVSIKSKKIILHTIKY